MLIAFGIRRGAIPLRGDAYAVYETARFQPTPERPHPGFSFADRRELLGKEFQEFRNQPHSWPWVSVEDFDHDGFEDLLLVYRSYQPSPSPNAYWFQLLRNNQGRGFTDVTEERGLGALQHSPDIKAAVFVDMDNDGWPDLFITRRGAPPLFFRNHGGRFTEDSSAVPDVPLGDGWGIALLDYDRDGYLDVYVYNYSAPSQKRKRDDFAFNNVGNTDRGGPHFLLHNDHGKRFAVVPGALGLSNHFHTQAVGVGDFDGDGFPDIYASNDFGFDQLFMNQSGKGFLNRTDALGYFRSSNSMSASVGDVHNSGKLDVFATNVIKPGLTYGFNRLWQNRSAAGALRFADEAQDSAVAKCGWGWGSQILDFDKDGWQDIVMVNGRHGRQKDSDYWYYYTEAQKVLPWAKQHGLTGYGLFGQAKSVAPGERDCLFLSNGGRSFVDVAKTVGLTDELNGRSLVWFDMDNDGQEDLVVGNAEASELLYVGHRDNPNQWLGLKLEGVKSNRMAYGAKLWLTTEKLRQMREIYTTNGFLSQSSPRLIFGIPAGDKFKELEIHWPSGAVQKLSGLRLNQYHRIKETL